MRILVTGGTGFVGSHVAVALIEAGHEAVIVDNLSNSQLGVIDGIESITGYRPPFFQLDIGDRTALREAIGRGVDSVVHLAALKAVGESVASPLRYYGNNVGGTVRMLEVLSEAGLRSLVFSSSATVYGQPEHLPLREDMPIGRATNPYGWTKIMMEQVMADLACSDPSWSMTFLRYFNPVGAHESGKIGEAPNGVPSNLMPYVNQVAAEIRPALPVFGTDYPTRDGTPIRDYVHVMDVAEGHARAVGALTGEPGTYTYNLGTGRGTTVLELVSEFETTNGVSVPWNPHSRRPGDVAESWAAVDRAAHDLGWRAKRDLSDMCRDAWHWQQIGQASRSDQH
ncbi:MAG: UDP-glucose 4-epimerase GalE [Acidimicrobiia bacterium]